MKIVLEFSLSKEDRELLRRTLVLTEDLTSAVLGLTASVDALAARQPVTVPPIVTGGSVSDADVQQAIDGVKTQTARINTLVNPNPATPILEFPTPATDFTDPLNK
jgi:hypothetical protein